MVDIQRLIDLPKDRSFFLFGPRQTGKTTLLKKTFLEDHSQYFDLLDPRVYFRLKKDPARLLEEINALPADITHVVIDEVQKIPDLLDTVHYLLENTDNSPHFVLTGSSARRLKRGQANMLGGRLPYYKLFTINSMEIDQTDSVSLSLHKLLESGSLPKIFNTKPDDISIVLNAYIDTYIREEIQAEALVRSLDHFIGFIAFAAEENGNTLNYTKISKDIGISANTIKEYYQILDDTLLGFFLQPYSRTARKSLVKSKRFYFFDTGIVRAFNRELSTPLLEKTKAFGIVFEHFIIKEIVHIAQTLNKNFKFSFYRTEAGAEVDLVISLEDKSEIAVEIKGTNDPSQSSLKGLKSFAQISPEARLVCVCTAPNRYAKADIEIYPWQDFIQELFTQ